MVGAGGNTATDAKIEFVGSLGNGNQLGNGGGETCLPSCRMFVHPACRGLESARFLSVMLASCWRTATAQGGVLPSSLMLSGGTPPENLLRECLQPARAVCILFQPPVNISLSPHCACACWAGGRGPGHLQGQGGRQRRVAPQILQDGADLRGRHAAGLHRPKALRTHQAAGR